MEKSLSEEELRKRRVELKRLIPLSKELLHCSLDPFGYWSRQSDEKAVDEIGRLFKQAPKG